MDDTRLPLLFLRVFLGFLIVTALLAIGIVLLGDMSDTQGRILGTSAVISGASVAAMACAAFRGRSPLSVLGTAGIALCLAAGAATVVAIWRDTHNEIFGRFLVCLVTVAGFTALGQLLWLLTLAQQHRWVQKSTSATITLLTMLICVQVAASIHDNTLARTSIAVAIVLALQILAHPILWQLGRRAGDAAQRRLLLRHERDDIWTDGAGRHYSVRPHPGDEH